MKTIPFQDFVRRYFSGEEFVLFDTETGGLNTFHDEIIEIGAMIISKNGKTKEFEEIMKVNINKINPIAWSIHKIPKDKIESARSQEDVLKDFVEFCGNRVLIAHNIKFDFPMLNSNLIRNGLKPYQNDDVACTLVYAKEQMLPGKLSNLAQHYNITTQAKNLHRALYDVDILKGVLESMMKENEPEDMQYSIIL